MRRWATCLIAITASMFVAAPAWACGGLIAPNGTINLLRTTTLAGYHEGVEHYVTSFEFAGGGGEFGSIVPLPGIPSDVVRGGDWTLQRLVEEVSPPVTFDAERAGGVALAANAEVILEKRIDALDITILKGGGDAVGEWAIDNGFALTPDSPEMLDFYAARSPIFMAARFDASEVKRLGQGLGDGTPIHLSIPTQNPWVPLRILALGRRASETVEADVFLLTERVPSILLPQIGFPGTTPGVSIESSGPAPEALLSDLRSDRGMKWLPASGMWLNYIRIDTPASELDYDLAMNVTGGRPSPVDAGLTEPYSAGAVPNDPGLWWPWALATIGAAITLAGAGKFASDGR